MNILGLWAHGADGVRIVLREEAQVRDAVVLLEDVADVQGGDAETVRILRHLALGPAPEYGAVWTLTRSQVLENLKSDPAIPPIRDFSGAAAVRIKLQGTTLELSAVAQLMKDHLARERSWDPAEIESVSIRNLEGIELPPGDNELRIGSGGIIWGKRSLLAPLEVVRAGQTVRCLWVTADVRIRANLCLAARSINSGRLLGEADVYVGPVEIADLRASYFRDAREVIGKASRRSLATGAPLTSEALKEPCLIKSGDTVNLTLERNGIVLTSLARAEQDGILGQTIRVRGIEFPAVLKARVTGNAQVVIQ